MEYKEIKISFSHMFISSNFDGNLTGNIEFNSNNGHSLRISLTVDEANTMKELVKNLKTRAMTQIPEMITEAKIQERVNIVVEQKMADLTHELEEQIEF